MDPSSPSLGDLPEPSGLPTRAYGYPKEEAEEAELRKERKEREEDEELGEKMEKEDLKKVYQQNQDMIIKLRYANVNIISAEHVCISLLECAKLSFTTARAREELHWREYE